MRRSSSGSRRTGRGSKGGSTSGRVDLLPGRERILPAARSPGHLGAPWSDTGADPPVLLVADVHGRRPRVPPRPQSRQADLPDQAGQLQHRKPHRIPHRPASTPARQTGDPDLGRTVRAPLQRYEGLAGHPTTLATRRGTARLRPRPQPMELVWGNLKATELANLCPDALDEADTAAHTGLQRIGSSYELCFNFLAHTGLHL